MKTSLYPILNSVCCGCGSSYTQTKSVHKHCTIYCYNRSRSKIGKPLAVPEIRGEVWKDIVGYEGYYQVSNLGNVKSVDRVVDGKRFSRRLVGKLKSPQNNRVGYLTYGLTKDSKQTYFTAHRLVATAFIPNTNQKPCVNHINGIKTDNRVENLEWVTMKENVAHAINTGLRNTNGERNFKAKLSNIEAEEVRKAHDGKYGSTIRLARKYNVNKATITNIIYGKSYRTVSAEPPTQ